MAERITDANQYRVYYPTYRRNFWWHNFKTIVLLWLGSVGMAVLMTGNYSEHWLLVMLFATGYWWVIVLIVYGQRWLDIRKARIVVSDEVIEYHNGNYTIIGGWQNVDGIRMVYYGKTRTECLVFKSATYYGSTWLRTWRGWKSPFARSIPLDEFVDWRHSELGNVLRSHIPNGQLLIPTSSHKISGSNDDLIQAHLEDFLGSLANPTKRRLPRR